MSVTGPLNGNRDVGEVNLRGARQSVIKVLSRMLQANSQVTISVRVLQFPDCDDASGGNNDRDK